ncbi:8155_t:CDS:2 [Entrophospora sp. SA101]|nr:8155_t:CDS:2 [Entrophospora sp. SA101]
MPYSTNSISTTTTISSYGSSQQSSRNLGNFTPLWRNYLSDENKEESQEIKTLNLGDFGSLWSYLSIEKEKWSSPSLPSKKKFAQDYSKIEVDVKTNQLLTNHDALQQPLPLLNNSSSSEYSTEEEITKNKNNEFGEHKIILLPQINHRPQQQQSIKSSNNEKAKININELLLLEKEKVKTYPLKIPIPTQISNEQIHVFIDNSNILVGFLATCKLQKHAHKLNLNNYEKRKSMLSYTALFTILERGRNVARKVLVASSPLYQNLDEARDAGYDVSVLQRVKKNESDDFIITTTSNTITNTNNIQEFLHEAEKEQCVDELLQLKIFDSLLDYHTPATLVLASGDGKDGEYFQGGFHKCVIKALERGWKVEIISWKRQLSQNFLNKRFLNRWKGRYHVVFLDWFSKELGCEY